jgi:hypothetical protein
LNGLIENQIKDFDEKIRKINSLEQTLKDKIGNLDLMVFDKEKILLHGFFKDNNIQNIIKNISGSNEFLNNKIQTINQKLEEIKKNVKHKLEEELKDKLKNLSISKLYK